MNTKIRSITLVVLLIATILLGTMSIMMFASNEKYEVAYAEWEGEGSGTEDDPYLIGTKAQLEKFRDIVNKENGETGYGPAFGKLTADIDLECDADHQWTPIGNQNDTYKWHFDGDNHTVSGIYISGTQYTETEKGLFGYVNPDGVIENVIVDGTISGYDMVGGIAGHSRGLIQNCYNKATISSVADTGAVYGAGGIVGYCENGLVDNCHNLGNISGKVNIGGVIGEASNGRVRYCSNVGTINATAHGAGGIVGYLYTDTPGKTYWLQNSYNMGAVSSDYDAGGIVGNLAGCYVAYCYNRGNITGNSRAGSICGLYGGGSQSYGNYYLQGTAATATGQGDDSGYVLTAEQFKDKSKFINDSLWDFEVAWRMGRDFPFLRSYAHQVAEKDNTANAKATGVDLYQNESGWEFTLTMGEQDADGYTKVDILLTNTSFSDVDNLYNREFDFEFDCPNYINIEYLEVTDENKVALPVGTHYKHWNEKRIYFTNTNDSKATYYLHDSRQTAVVSVTAAPITYGQEANYVLSVSDNITDEYAIPEILDTVVASSDYDTTKSAGEFDISLAFKAGKDGDSVYGYIVTLSDNTPKLTVAKAPLTVTAKNKSITVGDAPANDGVTYSGFVNSDSATVLTGTLTYNYNYQQGGAAGTYNITPGGLTSDNYDISFVNGTLTVVAPTPDPQPDPEPTPGPTPGPTPTPTPSEKSTIVDDASGVSITTKEGVDIPENVVLRVEVKTTVKAKEIEIDNEKVKALLKENEVISKVYDVKLIKTVNGVESEVQPTDLDGVSAIIVKMVLPEDAAKSFRLIHIHSADDVEEVKVLKVVGKEVEFEITRLSEFAFITVREPGLAGWAIALIVVGSILAACACCYFLLFFAFNKFIVIDGDVYRAFVVKKNDDEIKLITYKCSMQSRDKEEVFDTQKEAQDSINK